MKHLNVLVTTSYYWPEGAGSAPYLAGLAEHLASLGHRVVVATTFPHYPEWKLRSRGRLAETTTQERVRVRRRWAYVPRRQSALHRALYEASLFSGGVTALPMRPSPDVVVGTCPSLAGGLLAATAAAAYRVPFGLVLQDVMGLAAAQSGIAGGAKVASVVRRTELALARRAERIAIIAEGFRNYFVEGGVDPNRIDRLRNWTRRTEPAEPREQTRERFGWSEDELVCLHGGNMGHKQGLDNLLHASAALGATSVRVVLAGDGNDRDRLQRLARELRLDRVQFVDLQGPGRWEELMQASDVLLVNQRASVADMSLPSKLTSYFAAGRPVIAAASAESETAREIELAGAGVVVPPNDPKAFADAIVSMKEDLPRARAHSANAIEYATEQLARPRVLRDYEHFIERLVARTATGDSQSRA